MRNFFRTLAPEKFNAKVEVRADGSYEYSYDGTLIFVPALIRAFTVGLNARLDAQLAKAVAQLGQEGFRNVIYVGDARYSVTLERACSRGAPSFFPSREMSVFSIKPQIDGLIVVAASPYDPAAPYQLAGTDAEIEGELLVMADRGVEVVQHNATASQITSNLASCFMWRIKSPYDNPCIILRPPGINEAARELKLLAPSISKIHDHSPQLLRDRKFEREILQCSFANVH
jgi:hypothetical protein